VVDRAKYFTNHNRIELIITYRCNMKCINCEAQVRQAPSSKEMSVKQISKFIRESIENNIRWESIRVLGGEPTLHSEIYSIIECLDKYKRDFSPNTVIMVVTNGYGNFVNRILSELSTKYSIMIENSKKTSNLQSHFSPINQAPMDLEAYKNCNFINGCWIPTICGIALDIHGYYPCSAAAAIARVFGLTVARKTIPLSADDFTELLSVFCEKCGHYYSKINNAISHRQIEECTVQEIESIINSQQVVMEEQITKEIISPIWEKALYQWKIKEPKLTKY